MPAILGVVYLAASLLPIFATNHTETYCLPLQWTAVLILLGWKESGGHEGRYGFVLGLLLGAQFFLQQNLIGAAVRVALVISLILLAQRKPWAWGRFTVAAFAGFALIVGTFVAYLASQGALSPF